MDPIDSIFAVRVLRELIRVFLCNYSSDLHISDISCLRVRKCGQQLWFGSDFHSIGEQVLTVLLLFHGEILVFNKKYSEN